MKWLSRPSVTVWHLPAGGFAVQVALAALATPLASSAAPVAGARYMVDGRCVTVTRVQGTQADYEWTDGQMNGWGNLPVRQLTVACGAAPETGPTEQPAAPARPGAGAVAPPVVRPVGPPVVRPVVRPGSSHDTPEPPAGAAARDDSFRDEILRAHNQFRCQHGVPPLSWHPEVATYAQSWVERGRYAHSDSYEAALGPMGENLFGASGVPSASAAVADWYSESRGYAYGGHGSSASGHFTALIWKDARYLGCARANGIISCNYWAGSKLKDCAVPNMQGCYPQQVLPTSRDASACR